MLDKIQALLAKARDSACTEAEAQSCMVRARRLMDEYGVTEEAVEKSEVGDVSHSVKYLEQWRKILFMAVARYYGCEIMFRGSDKNFVVAGRESSRVVTISMIDWLDETVVRLAREWRRSSGATRSEQLNFEKACGARIAMRLKEMTIQATAGDGSGSALVIRSELQAAQSWLAEKYKTKETRLRVTARGAGGVAGRAAGNDVGLSAQVRGAGGGPLQIGSA